MCIEAFIGGFDKIKKNLFSVKASLSRYGTSELVLEMVQKIFLEKSSLQRASSVCKQKCRDVHMTLQRSFLQIARAACHDQVAAIIGPSSGKRNNVVDSSKILPIVVRSPVIEVHNSVTVVAVKSVVPPQAQLLLGTRRFVAAEPNAPGSLAYLSTPSSRSSHPLCYCLLCYALFDSIVSVCG